jgi:uncharacterized membrane protein
MRKLFFVLTFVFILFWIVLFSMRFNNFGYYDWDLAFFAQAMWNLAHGSTFASILQEGSFFGNHANFIALFFAPFYKIWPHPLFLVFLKVFSLAGAGWFIFRYAEREIGDRCALFIVALYFFYPPNVFGLIYEFDIEALGVIVVAGMFYAYIRNYWKPFMLAGVILILTKENLPLLMCTFAIHALFAKKEFFKWTFLPFMLGSLSFIFLTTIAVPFFAGHGLSAGHPYAYQYAKFGSSIPDILLNMVIDPGKLLGVLFSRVNQMWFLHTIGIFCFLPLVGVATIFLVFPIILMNLLSSPLQRHMITYSYVLVIAPFIFFALIQGLKCIPRYRVHVCVAISILCLFSLLQFLPEISGRLFPYPFSMNESRRHIMSLVPKGVPVVAAFPFLSHMTDRVELYPLYKIYSPEYAGFYKLPSHVKYALTDDADIWYDSLVRSGDKKAEEHLNSFLKNGWDLVERQGAVALYVWSGNDAKQENNVKY